MATGATGKGQSTNVQSATIAAHIKALQNKKLPSYLSNARLCNPIQGLANVGDEHSNPPAIGDCELAAVLHMLKIQYKMINKEFDIPDDQGSFLFVHWGSSSDQKAYDLAYKIENKYAPNNWSSVLSSTNGIDEHFIDTYAKNYGLFGATYSKVHALNKQELTNIDLLKRLIYFYGCIPVGIMLTEHEYNAINGNDTYYNFDIPSGCPWSGTELLNTLQYLFTGILFTGDDVNNGYGIRASNVPEFINYYSLYSDQNGKLYNISSWATWGASAFIGEQILDPTHFGPTYWRPSDHPAYYKVLSKFSSWGDKSGNTVGGHEILLTGWNDKGFEFVTWNGAGRMSYDYWYLHHLNGRVIIPDVWNPYIQGKDATLLLSTL